ITKGSRRPNATSDAHAGLWPRRKRVALSTKVRPSHVQDLIDPTGHVHVGWLGVTQGEAYGDFVMMEVNHSTQSQQRKFLSARRLRLLGSVAFLGAAVAFAGPLEHGNFSHAFWASSAQASEAQQGPA